MDGVRRLAGRLSRFWSRLRRGPEDDDEEIRRMEEAFAAAMSRRGGRPACLRRLAMEEETGGRDRGRRCAEDHGEFLLFRRNACQLMEQMLVRLEEHQIGRAHV